jgi:tetratricopeptide (TPR) repeat protein
LYDAAKYGSEALDKTREGDLYRADRLHTLSSVLFKKYYHDQNFDDLKEALQLAEQAISCAREKESVRASTQMRPAHFFSNHLAAVLLTRFERSHDSEDLDRSIVYGQQAVSGSDGQHPVYLGNVGHSLLCSYEITKDPKDLEKAICLLRKGVETCRSGQKSGLLGNLGIALSLRFRATADISDIDSAIAALDEAIHSCPPSNVSRGIYLNTRACLRTFKTQGNLITSAFVEDPTKL